MIVFCMIAYLYLTISRTRLRVNPHIAVSLRRYKPSRRTICCNYVLRPVCCCNIIDVGGFRKYHLMLDLLFPGFPIHTCVSDSQVSSISLELCIVGYHMQVTVGSSYEGPVLMQPVAWKAVYQSWPYFSVLDICYWRPRCIDLDPHHFGSDVWCDLKRRKHVFLQLNECILVHQLPSFNQYCSPTGIKHIR